MKKLVSVIIACVMVLTISVSAFAGHHSGYKRRRAPEMSPEVKAKITAAVEAYKEDVTPLKEKLYDLKKKYREAKKAEDQKTADALLKEIKVLKNDISVKRKALKELTKSLASTEKEAAEKKEYKKSKVKENKIEKEVKISKVKKDKIKKYIAKEVWAEVKTKIKAAVEAYKKDVAPVKEKLKGLYEELCIAKEAEDKEKADALLKEIKTVKGQLKDKTKALHTLIKDLLTTVD